MRAVGRSAALEITDHLVHRVAPARRDAQHRREKVARSVGRDDLAPPVVHAVAAEPHGGRVALFGDRQPHVVVAVQQEIGRVPVRHEIPEVGQAVERADGRVKLLPPRLRIDRHSPGLGRLLHLFGERFHVALQRNAPGESGRIDDVIDLVHQPAAADGLKDGNQDLRAKGVDVGLLHLGIEGERKPIVGWNAAQAGEIIGDRQGRFALRVHDQQHVFRPPARLGRGRAEDTLRHQ